MSKEDWSAAPEIVSKPSPETVLLFVKHAALDLAWTPAQLAASLGIDTATAKQIAAELALVGYVEAVPRKRDEWRNTPAGNTVASVKPPRLKRETAQELLTDVVDRAEAFNLDETRSLSVDKIVAFGGVNSSHEKIQDLDIGVQFQSKLGREATGADFEAALKTLRGRSPSLKMHLLNRWPKRMGRVIWSRDS